MIKENIREALKEALLSLSIEAHDFDLEPPTDVTHGDYTTNAALAHAKTFSLNPVDLGKRIAKEMTGKIPGVKKIEVAGAGFVNVYLSDDFFCNAIEQILKAPQTYGRSEDLKGRKIIFEYTDPNPFKEFHIGHLMSNTIGESLSRFAEFSGAEVKRANYQGDMGLNVAKAIWGMERLRSKMPAESDPLQKRMTFVSEAYVLGAAGYEEAEAIKNDVDELNARIFSRRDSAVNALYDKGRAWSLESFEHLYKILGTKFDFYFFESQTAPLGGKIVSEHMSDGVFEKSDGAVVFRGEKHGLHTRVFVNSEGFPTYEGKELGLGELKFRTYPYDESVIITANEQNDYFKVVLKAMEEIYPEIAKKTKHISHGMMRFASGKMSSRTGNVITGESLIIAMKNLVMERIKERELSADEKQKIAEAVAISAIKYSILRSAIGSDIIYDFEKSISFEGDSGPYLQYTCARARSVLKKAKSSGSRTATEAVAVRLPSGPILLERLLYRFPEVVERAAKEFEPHYIATYLIELSAAFNNFYAHNKIIGSDEEDYRLALTEAVATTIKNGLYILGIKAPERM